MSFPKKFGRIASVGGGKNSPRASLPSVSGLPTWGDNSAAWRLYSHTNDAQACADGDCGSWATRFAVGVVFAGGVAGVTASGGLRFLAIYPRRAWCLRLRRPP